MKFSHTFAVILIGLLAVSTGCNDTVEPEKQSTPGPAAQPASDAPLTAFPVISNGELFTEGAIRPYDYSGYNSFHGGILASRYVLYRDSTFSLEFLSPKYGFFKYNGKYSRADSLINFVFTANLGQWTAEGTLRGDSVLIRYNSTMVSDDFVNGAYIRLP